MSAGKNEINGIQSIKYTGNSGSSAEIYVGEYNRIKVAIKVIVQNPGYYESKMYDTELAFITNYKIQHPNIITYIGVTKFQDVAKPSIVMEYAAYGDMNDYLKIKAPTVPNWESSIFPLKFASEICSGLKFLHDHGIIHRDLTLGNVLVTSNEQAKISDFGTCHVLNQEDVNGVHSTDDLFGTPNYLAPESIQVKISRKSLNQHSKASDVYGFGLVVLALFLLRVPYAQQPPISQNDLFKKIAKGETETTDQVPQCFRFIFDNIWQMDPSKRPDINQMSARLNVGLGFFLPKPQVVVPAPVNLGTVQTALNGPR